MLLQGQRPGCRSHLPSCLQVVSLALLFFAWKGYQFSWKFELGQEWDGYAPGLQPGMLGRRVVSGKAVRHAVCLPAFPRVAHMVGILTLPFHERTHAMPG